MESEILTVGGAINVVENLWSVGETVGTYVGSEEAEKC